ncbi:substance-K receptor [Nematostella vectensis]|uniref:substance-K receptor n=1 Tax=Nematostella vectensis TaxID=45351 RepID=UPI0020778D5C|nr:substance-K receptor [Nematostella vectensis]
MSHTMTTPIPTLSSPTSDDPTEEETRALNVLFSILALVNLTGNSLVAWIILRHRQMTSSLNGYLLINLAVSDVMVALFMTPQYVFRFTFTHPGGRAGDWLCKMITGGNFIWVGGAASAFTLVAIAMERYHAIVNPCHHQLTRKRLALTIAGSWIYAILFNLPLFFVIGYEKHGDDFRCPEKWTNKPLAELYTVGAFFIFGAIPIGIMLIVYPMIIRVLWQPNILPTQRPIIEKRQKAVRMMLVVTVLYFVCWLPNLVLYMMSQFHSDVYNYFHIPYVISIILVGLNSTMNPFVYSLHSSRFKEEFRRWFASSNTGKRLLVKDNKECNYGYERFDRQ